MKQLLLSLVALLLTSLGAWAQKAVMTTVSDALTYTLTDEAGNTYTGEYTGTAGTTEPNFTGVSGYTLSNKVWDGNAFSATITFPFPVSSENQTNPIMISSLNIIMRQENSIFTSRYLTLNPSK